MDTPFVLKGFFLVLIATILLVHGLNDERFLAYGARASSAPKSKPGQQRGWLQSFLDWVAGWRVPHVWFLHFYVVSVLSSLFWLLQLLTKGRIFQLLVAQDETATDEPSMSINQIVLCWCLLLAQGTRRLVETMKFTKPSESKMWVVHWLVGILFYIAMGIAIWVEGKGALLSTAEPVEIVRLTAPSLRTFLFLPVFLLASGIQHDCHLHLAQLQKYSTPSHPAFASVVCPHYTAECAIYLSLAVLAAPMGCTINQTLLTALIFVVVNLGTSADLTRRWYIDKFGADVVGDRWRMIPYIW